MNSTRVNVLSYTPSLDDAAESSVVILTRFCSVNVFHVVLKNMTVKQTSDVKSREESVTVNKTRYFK